MNRRDFVSLAGLAGAKSLLGPPTRIARQPPSQNSASMVVGCQRAPTDARRLQHFKRHGVDHICGYPPNSDHASAWTVESLSALRDRCESHGVSLDMIEFPMMTSASIDQSARKAIMLGREPDRQQEIDQVCTII